MEEEGFLPPGFRFYPTEEELISFYLYNKLHGTPPELDRVIPSINIYNFEPQGLPGLVGEVCKREMEQWFFFMPQQDREARGGRPNRSTDTGYWKATGSPSYVYSSHHNKAIGLKKTMVFYEGKAPNGKKTKWKMNEYKAIIHDDANSIVVSTSDNIPMLRHEFSLCRVYVTSGCARAFDRRPLVTMPYKNNNNNTCLEIKPETTLMKRNRSTGSLDSGVNDHITLRDPEAYDLDMTEALEPLLDWEQLGWL